MSVLIGARFLIPYHAPNFHHALRFLQVRGIASSIPSPPAIADLRTPEDNALARSWIEQFKAKKVTKDLVELTFSRSSGPGGQNVNKVNTKAMLRCPVKSDWIPAWAQEPLKQSPSYVSSSQSLLITSTVFRSQAQNVQDCLEKLHALILSAASAPLINEPSEEQKQRVRRLEQADKARRRLDKERRSAVKRGRSSKGGWE